MRGIGQQRRTVSDFAGNIQKKTSAAAVAVGHLAAQAVTKVASAAVSVTKQALDVVKEYEQNLGGSEAVWGEWADSIQAKSTKAFKNMGLSASDYLATANKMGSLFKGAGFTTGEALDKTTQAMQRAADVASVMGIDADWAMESIAGLAKGNFTMMDNLGVAINDTTLANYALEKGIKKSVRAMTTQEKIGLALELFMERTADYAGNYAKENDTLAGSYEVLSAAYENMLIGQEGATDDFVDALEMAAKATLKNLGQIIPRLGASMLQAIKKAAPKIKAAFVDLWDNKLPGIIKNGANAIINAINDIFGTNIPTISEIKFPTWAEMETGFSAWWAGTKESLKGVATWALNLFENPYESGQEIRASFSEWWTNTAVPAIAGASQWALSLFGMPVEDDATILEHVNSWWNVIGIIVSDACSWVLQLFGLPTETADAIFGTIKEWWEGVGDLLTAACSWVLGEPTPPSAENTIKKIKNWWEDVKRNISLSLGFAFVEQEGNGSNIHYSSSEGMHGGGVGKRFGEPVYTPPNHVGLVYTPNRVGLDYVPYDGYLSQLHVGEAVLTRTEAERWRRGEGNGSGVEIDYNRLASAVALAVSGISVSMDSQAVGRLVSPTVSREIAHEAKARRFSR